MTRPAVDLVISPLGADAAVMVEAARRAEEAGFDGLWTLDHFSATMLGKPWSREPFTVLGAMAAATERVRLGPLVANAVNRHPSLLTSALATLQSVSGGRAVLGLGTGAGPGSRFAGEQDAIGRVLADDASRRAHLAEVLESIRLIWEPPTTYAGQTVTLRDLDGVVGPEARPPMIVGANGPKTLAVACTHADGVNIRLGARCRELVELARAVVTDRPFEVSVLAGITADRPSAAELDEWQGLGVDRWVLTLAGDAPLDRIDELAG